MLFSSGKEFELRLLFTQAQAMGYANHLSKAVLEKVDDPEQKSFLQNAEKQTSDYHDRLMGILIVK